jgi:flagellar M-ring protein FliF
VKSIQDFWNALNMRRKLLVAGATLVMFFGVMIMAQMAAKPNYDLLFGDLDARAASEVVSRLEQRSIPYEVRGASVFVPSKDRDSLRMQLAGDGLLVGGSAGYELLDELTGFGTTSQMFDAAYWRSKEGELARTIASLDSVANARVHIANPDQSPFQEAATPTASVFLTTQTGGIDQSQARAMRFLVASSVSGLTADNVSVVDEQGRLIANEATAAEASLADDRSDAIRDKVKRLVEARVGPGNAVVEVSVETITDSESILERRFDPDGRVAISTDLEESSTQSENGAAASVTVASNLPDGDAAAAQGANSKNSETRERVNYEVSETTREITRLPGSVKRQTVAVLVNGQMSTDDQGRSIFVPVPEDELTALRDLVASAVGFDENRGDVITLRSLPFDAPQVEGSGPLAVSLLDRLDLAALAKIGLLGLVLMILGLIILRPALRSAQLAPSVSLPTPEVGLDSELVSPSILPPSDLISEPNFALPATADLSDFDLNSDEDLDPVERLRQLIDTRKDDSVEVLRGWLTEGERT